MDVMASWLIPMTAGRHTGPIFLHLPPAGTPDNEIQYIARLIFEYLKSSQADALISAELLKLLFRVPRIFEMDELALTMAVLSNPQMRTEIPELRHDVIYGIYMNVVRRGNSAQVIRARGRINFDDLPDETIAAIKLITKRRRTI